jgi:hypothetical protein
VLLAKARRAVRLGGEALAKFKTESMCINVPHMDPALSASGWRAGLIEGPRPAAQSRTALCLDLSPDGLHATLVGAVVLADQRVGAWVAGAWDGAGCTTRLRRDLPGLIAQIKPAVLGWLPAGPAAALAADMRERPGWPPAGVTVESIRGEAPAVCMGLAEQVENGLIVHAADPLLDAQVEQVEWLNRGDGKVFSRRGEGHCDAVYAMAGAVHLARTLPPPVGKPRLIVAPD